MSAARRAAENAELFALIQRVAAYDAIVAAARAAEQEQEQQDVRSGSTSRN